MPTNVKLDTKINQISLKYKQLKKSDIDNEKRNHIKSLKLLCDEGLKIIEKQNPSSQNLRKKKHIQDILKICSENQRDLQKQLNVKDKINNDSRMITLKSKNNEQGESQMSMYRKSRAVARTIVEYQFNSKHIKITNEQLDQIAERMETNHNIMKQIQGMIIQQGGDLDIVQTNLKKTYELVQNANMQLEEAAKIQNQTRLLKIKLGLTGIFGVIGLKVLGIPGMIAGLFGGIVTVFK